jgi:D-alanyl-D-alanine carboxypeptidase/Putative peptidoglycan binding domain
MAFPLSRGGRNVPAEVQRWQYFLLKQGIPQVGSIDSDFGMKTETATKFFQVSHGITANGKVNDRTLQKAEELGYTILPDNYYQERAGANFPRSPTNLTSPDNATRNRDFTCFKFIQRPRNLRPDAEAIVQKGSCDGRERDWVATHIVEFDMPQLKFARGYDGRFRCHSRAADKFRALFAKWEEADLLHLIMSYEGCFVPRYKRRQAPPGENGHGEKKSSAIDALSNHSFGSAFDINFPDNQLGDVPAMCGRRGSTRELVAAANSLGTFWGGHFGTQDGMHFEISKL